MERAFTVCLVALVLFAAACGGGGDGGGGAEEPEANGSDGASAAVVGTHRCKNPEDTAPTIYEFAPDGSVAITAPGYTDSGTWSGEGNTFTMSTEGGESTLTLKGGQLVFDGAPFYECTKAG